MSDKDNFDAESDGEFYDDALDQNFEFEEDYDDLDLESELEDSDSDAVYDEEFEDDWENEEEGVESAPVPKKKSKLGLNFNTIVIIGAVAVGGFIMMSQVKKEKAKVQETQASTSQTIPTALKMDGAFNGPGAIKKKKDDIISTFETSKIEEEDEEGFFFGGDILDKTEDVINDAPPMPSPIASAQDVGEGTRVSNVTLALIEEAENSTGILANEGENKISNSPDPADSVAFAQEAYLGEEVPVQEEKAAAGPDIGENKTESVFELGVEKVEETEVSLPSLASTKDTAGEGSSKASLSTKLDNIINQLEAMETKIEGIEKTNNERIGTIIGDIEALKTRKSSAPKKVKKKARKKAVQTVRWELRAAQPGKAWVSQKGNGSKTMKPVVIGDQLRGIGRIQSISYINNGWVVRGSTGKITQ